MDVGRDVLDRQRAAGHQTLRPDLTVLVRGDAADGREGRPVVARPALIEVVQAEPETVREHARQAEADLAVVDRVPVVVALLEKRRAFHQAVDAGKRREEGAVLSVVEGVRDAETPRPWQVSNLDRTPVARIPVCLEEGVRERADVTDVPEALQHPERDAEIVPAEGRRRDLHDVVPRGVERVGAVEHTEVVGFAPDDLLLAEAKADRNVRQADVDVRFAELVLELEGVARALREVVKVALGGAPRLAAAEVALTERRLVVVDAVVYAAVEQEELRALDERQIEAVDPLALLDPVPVDAGAERIALLDEVVLVDVRVTDDVLRLEIARQLERAIFHGRRSDRSAQ